MTSSERRVLLLDTNALLALAWPNHQFHRAVVERLIRRPVSEWATCLLTQLGFVRLSSNPAIVEARISPGQALDVLTRLIGDGHHRYLDVLPSLVTLEESFRRLLGHQQVTDAYLLAAAEANNAVLVTLDRRLTATAGTRGHVEILTP